MWSSKTKEEFYTCIADLIEEPAVQAMDDIPPTIPTNIHSKGKNAPQNRSPAGRFLRPDIYAGFCI